MDWSQRTPGAGVVALVDVYRNLNRPGVCYSIRGTGRRPRVLDRREWVVLAGPVRFVVQAGGQARAQREGRRNVHAWVRGELADGDIESTTSTTGWRRATYDPFSPGGFRDALTGEELERADGAVLDATGLMYLPRGSEGAGPPGGSVPRGADPTGAQPPDGTRLAPGGRCRTC